MAAGGRLKRQGEDARPPADRENATLIICHSTILQPRDRRRFGRDNSPHTRRHYQQQHGATLPRLCMLQYGVLLSLARAYIPFLPESTTAIKNSK